MFFFFWTAWILVFKVVIFNDLVYEEKKKRAGATAALVEANCPHRKLNVCGLSTKTLSVNYKSGPNLGSHVKKKKKQIKICVHTHTHTHILERQLGWTGAHTLPVKMFAGFKKKKKGKKNQRLVFGCVPLTCACVRVRACVC